MSELVKELTNGLQTGFVDSAASSQDRFRPRLLLNDKNLSQTVLADILSELTTCDEFFIAVAFVTKGGVNTIINVLKELEQRGINGKFLVSQYLNFSQPEALKSLIKFNNIENKIVVNKDFHSKGYLFKKSTHYNLVIGSSNLTDTALKSNKELNIKFSAMPSSHILKSYLEEFETEFKAATVVDENFIEEYSKIYDQAKLERDTSLKLTKLYKHEIKPNKMQICALHNLEKQRSNGINKSLLISATGTGKTYLAAFEVKQFNPKKMLFVVHRKNIANKAMKSFRAIFGHSKKMDVYKPGENIDALDFVFCMIQTISQDQHLEKFSKDEFDYIVVDETHRAGASSYQKVLSYFTPKFLLGMTATPERTDGYDIFSTFGHNIAFEIRLHEAMDQKMLCPFHYFGVTDFSVDNKEIEEKSDFKLLVANERVDRILEKSEFYGCDSGNIRGLVFCSENKESLELSNMFNQRGYRTLALSGSSSEKEREDAINNLETGDPSRKLDYIFSVDIFSEGIDIPMVNQIIMLRPTNSAIIFVQQLGRGLRKADGKEFLTVIDFIGNYQNNYMVPIALYGDTTYNKDQLRNLMSRGSNMLSGPSTINFDEITRKRIFDSINTANMNTKRDLKKDYTLLKYKIGRYPMMIDFINSGSRDPFAFVDSAKSYLEFVEYAEDDYDSGLTELEKKFLEFFSKEVNNGKRLEESLILKHLIEYGDCSIEKLTTEIEQNYGYTPSDETIESAVRNINFNFTTIDHEKNKKTPFEVYKMEMAYRRDNTIMVGKSLKKAMQKDNFKIFLTDGVAYSIHTFKKSYSPESFFGGFIIGKKYSRKDVFRILNWEKNEVELNVGGYKASSDGANMAIYINYHKDQNNPDTVHYEDHFVSNSELDWMSKKGRTLSSPDMAILQNHRNGLRVPLFVKKENAEGSDYYYLGDMKPRDGSFKNDKLKSNAGQSSNVVRVKFDLDYPVEQSLFEYITKSN